MPLPASPPHDVNRRARSLSSFAADSLRELITSGTLRPGEPLAVEEIAGYLSISGTPVREALHTLRVEGFVDSVRAKGFAVHPLTGDDIRDVFVVYASASGELAARAATDASDELVREITALHLEMQAAATRGDNVRVEEINHEFHAVINRAVDAPKLRWLVALMAKYAPRQFYPSIPGWPAASNDDHSGVVAAFVARDPDAARESMTEHIVHAGELLAGHFDSLTAASETA